MTLYYEESGITLYVGDCLEVLPTLPPESVDAIVTDPPYALTADKANWREKSGTDFSARPDLAAPRSNTARRRRGGFMGKEWDSMIPGPAFWEAVLRVAKPGAHLLAFGGTRTSHRLVCAIEDAGWEIRDTLMWVYGSGFPKSLDVSKAIDKEQGAKGEYGAPKSEAHAGWIARGKMRGYEGHEGLQRPWMDDPDAVDRNARQYLPATEEAKQWAGFGTALKPSVEPICLARKPLVGTVAGNVQRYGTGALNIDGCRIGLREERPLNRGSTTGNGMGYHGSGPQSVIDGGVGRWPANLLHDGSPDVVECFPEREGGNFPENLSQSKVFGQCRPGTQEPRAMGDSGSASRFFQTCPITAEDEAVSRLIYCAKASKADRYSEAGNDHPTVKPLALIQYLVRLITPPGGVVLDPFSGSGTTPKAARELGFRCIAIDLEERHQEIAKHRLNQTVLDFGGAA